MASNDLDKLYGSHIAEAEAAVARQIQQVVATGGQGTSVSPATVVSVATAEPTPDTKQADEPGVLTPRQYVANAPLAQIKPSASEASLDEDGALVIPTVHVTAPRRELVLDTPEVQAVKEHFREQFEKLRTGELAVEAVGRVGRTIAEAVAPGIELAGRAVGLDEEGAAAFSQGMVEFIAGLPGQSESEIAAGVETSLAVLPFIGPMVGTIIKGAKAVGKPASPVIAKALKSAVKQFEKDRAAAQAVGGSGGLPPAPPRKPTGGESPEFPHDPFHGEGRKAYDNEEAAWEQTRGQFEKFAASVTKQRRGPVLHDVDVIRLEKDVDLTLNAALGIPPGTALPPEKLLRVRNLLKGQFNAMKAANAVYRETGDIRDFGPLATAMGRTQGLLKVILGLYAEPARDVRIMRAGLPKSGIAEAKVSERFEGNPDAASDFSEREFQIADVWITKLYDFFVALEQESKARPHPMAPGEIPQSPIRALSDAIEMIQTEEQLVGFLKPLQNPLFWDLWKEQWYNAMLLALAPIKNIVGTPAILASEVGLRGVAAGIDAGSVSLLNLLTNGDFKRSVYFGEVGAMLNMRANTEAFLAGARLAWQSFKDGKPLFAVSMTENPFPAVSNTTLWLNTVGPMGYATSWMSTAARRWTSKSIDFASTMGGRLLLAGDTLNKVVGFQANLRAIALREAYLVVEREGLTGAEAVQRGQEIRRDVIANPGHYPELTDQSTLFAQYITLQQELGEAASAVGTIADKLRLGPREAGFPSGFPIGRFFLPFTTIMANSAKMAAEYSGPISLISPAVRNELLAGGSRAATQAAKIAFSSVVLDALYSLAQQGLITGNGPREKYARQGWMEVDGRIPNAWFDPVSKQYRSCTAFEPFCTITSAVADLHDIMSYTPPDELDKLTQATEALALAIVGNVGVKSWTQGLVGTLNTVVSGDFDSFQEWFAKTIPGLVTPYSGTLRQITAGIDPNLRAATDLIHSLQANIPGLSENLPPKRNALGRPLVRHGGWFNPFFHGHPSQDPEIWKVMQEVDIVPTLPRREIDGIPLSDKLYDEYVLAITEGLPEELASLIASRERYSVEEFKDGLRDSMSKFKEKGKRDFLDAHQEIRDAIAGKQGLQKEGVRTRPGKFSPGRLSRSPGIGE